MKIQHKRSAALDGDKAKEPTAAQTDFGEVCVNFNTQDPALFIRDNADNIVRVGGDLSLYQKIEDTPPPVFVCASDEINAQSPPAERLEGTLWWNTEEGILYVWYIDANSSQWVIAVPQASLDDVPPGTVVGEAPPAGAEEGQLWWNSDAAENGGGRLYVYYDNHWVDTSVPGAEGSYLTQDNADGRYLRIDAAAAAQTVASTEDVTFNGTTEHAGGVKVTGGTVGTVADGVWRNDSGLQASAKSSGADVHGLGVSHYGDGSPCTIASSLKIEKGAANGSTRQDYRGIYVTDIKTNTVGHTVYGLYLNLGTSGDGDNWNLFVNGTAPNYFKGNVNCDGIITAGGNPIDGAANGAKLANFGQFMVSNGTGSNKIFKAFTTGNSTPTIQFQANGYASFANRIDSGNGVRATGGAIEITAANDRGFNNSSSSQLANWGGNQAAKYYATGGASAAGHAGFVANNLTHGTGNSTFYFQAKGYSGVAGKTFYAFYTDWSAATNGDNYAFYGGGTAPSLLKGPLTVTKLTTTATGNENYFANITKAGPTSDPGPNTHQISIGNAGALGVYRAASSPSTNPCLTLSRNNASAGTGWRAIEFYIKGNKANGQPPTSFIKCDGSQTRTIDVRLGATGVAMADGAADIVKALQPKVITQGGETFNGFLPADLAGTFAAAVDGEAGATFDIGTLIDWDGTELETDVAEPDAEDLAYTEEVETEGVTQMVTRTRSWNKTGTRDLMQGVSRGELIPLLTKALQEALDRIEELESNTLQPLYSTFADLPNASDHHGKTAHVHSEGALYFAHAGNWVKLQNA